jgi:hypothetical protein
MSISALRRTCCIFSVVAVTVFSVLALVGCGNDDLDGKLICADGEAWVGDDLAYILNGDGSLVVANKIEDIWYESGTGTWSTSGNRITMDGETMAMASSYTVSGDGKTLKLYDQTFTKTSGITVQPRPKE